MFGAREVRAGSWEQVGWGTGPEDTSLRHRQGDYQSRHLTLLKPTGKHISLAFGQDDAFSRTVRPFPAKCLFGRSWTVLGMQSWGLLRSPSVHHLPPFLPLCFTHSPKYDQNWVSFCSFIFPSLKRTYLLCPLCSHILCAYTQSPPPRNGPCLTWLVQVKMPIFRDHPDVIFTIISSCTKIKP